MFQKILESEFSVVSLIDDLSSQLLLVINFLTHRMDDPPSAFTEVGWGGSCPLPQPTWLLSIGSVSLTEERWTPAVRHLHGGTLWRALCPWLLADFTFYPLTWQGPTAGRPVRCTRSSFVSGYLCWWCWGFFWHYCSVSCCLLFRVIYRHTKQLSKNSDHVIKNCTDNIGHFTFNFSLTFKHF